jgi:multidrug efflux system membrane fusion protein
LWCFYINDSLVINFFRTFAAHSVGRQTQEARLWLGIVSGSTRPHALPMNSRHFPASSPRWALLIASVSLLALGACSKPPEVETPVRAVRTLVLKDAGGLIDREFSGEVKARTETRLSFRVGGKVTQRLVELGQPVRAGQALALLDATDLRLSQDAARAGLAAAQVQVNQAQADFKRFQDLRAQGFISQAELERHQTTLKAAEASAAQARAQLSVQGNQAAYSSLNSTAAGVVTLVSVEPGQVVNPGEPVLTVAHDGPRDVVFAIPEDMGNAVRPLVGKMNAIKARRWGTEVWVPATIREMAAAADPASRTLLVKADVGRADVSLGQTASVAISVAPRIQAGVHVPLQALVEFQGRSAVWVLDSASMTVKQQPVSTGEVNGNVVLVASGIKPGQEIVTAGVHVLTSGQKVRRLLDASAAAATATAAASKPAL